MMVDGAEERQIMGLIDLLAPYISASLSMASIRWTRASSIRLRSRRYRNESATGQDPHPIDRAWSSPGSRFWTLHGQWCRPD